MKCYGPKINFDPLDDHKTRQVPLFPLTNLGGQQGQSYKLQVKVRVAKFYLPFLTTCNVFCGVSFLKIN